MTWKKLTVGALIIAVVSLDVLWLISEDQRFYLKWKISFAAIASLSLCFLSFAGVMSYLRPTRPHERKDALQIWAQIVGGAALIGGLAFTWWNLHVTQENAQRTLKVSERGQNTDRFVKGVELLGTPDKTEVRLAGVYALQGLAKDSPNYYWPILVLYAESLRNECPWNLPQRDTPDYSKKPNSHTVSALLAAIGDVHGTYPTNQQLDLSHVYARGVWLKDANFENMSLQSSNLSDVYFENVRLRRSNFAYSCLRGAKFTGKWNVNGVVEELDLNGVVLEGVNIESANLTSTNGIDIDQFKRSSDEKYVLTWNEATIFPGKVGGCGTDVKACLRDLEKRGELIRPAEDVCTRKPFSEKSP